MNFTDLSLDIETLGTEPGCVITQIGLAAFDAQGLPRSIKSKAIPINPQSCLDHGMHVSWSTISWWLQQAEKPRIGMALQVGYSLYDALHDMNEWCALTLKNGFNVWGNGATFDVSLLADAYKRAGSKAPWGFRNIRDMRTLCALCPPDLRVMPDTEHDAESDAIAQAQTIRNCTTWLDRKAGA